jgi:hypothetical protein
VLKRLKRADLSTLTMLTWGGDGSPEGFLLFVLTCVSLSLLLFFLVVLSPVLVLHDFC